MLALILAAGNGKRMNSSIPKVLHTVNGKSMLARIMATVKASANINNIVLVLGYKKDEILEQINDCNYVVQKQQAGTGDAVLAAIDHLKQFENVLVMPADIPLISQETLDKLIAKHKNEKNSATVLTAKVKNPYGYGRILRDKDSLVEIIEESHTDSKTAKINEINSGIYCFNSKELAEYITKIEKNTKNGEYYLTDIIKIFINNGKKIGICSTQHAIEIIGVNNKVTLSFVSSLVRKNKIRKLMEQGVTVLDPENTYIEDNVRIESDTVIYPGTVLEGDCIIGKNVTIIGNSRLKNSTVENNTVIESSVIIDSFIKENSKIGPFAHIRNQAIIGKDNRIGNFVEIKKSNLDNNVKVAHLSYIGDTDIGENTNIGAGVVTCNFDGIKKHNTTIGKNSFIGSGAKLIAPVNIGNNTIIGAGSVITEDVPDDALALGRARQVVKENWVKKREKI